MSEGPVGVDATCIVYPRVFAFDGERWRYVTSLGGTTLLGQAEQLRRGAGKRVRFIPSWVRLDHARRLADGSVRAQLRARDDGIVYVDHVQLAAIHHPPGHEVVSSSAMQWRALRQRDPQRFWALPTEPCRAPVSATWCAQLDQREVLALKNRVAAAYELDRANTYELDFGPVRDSKRAWLLLDGWKFKRRRELAEIERNREPSLEIRQADGSWRWARALAAPRGDTKTMAIALSELAWPTGCYQMRLSTGTGEGGHAMWCLDRARLVEATPAPLSIAKLGVRHASLGPDANHPWTPGETPRTYGRFTRYGEVTELVREPDERLVVMRQGDALDLRFDRIPAPPPGLETSLFLGVVVVFKPRVLPGADGPTVLTQGVDPLPRRHMGRYHASAPTHQHVEFHSYLAQWNTREHLPT